MEFSDLPPELLIEHTMPFLDRKNMVQLCLLNKTYNRICHDTNLWQNLLTRDYGVVERVSNPKLTYLKLYGNDLTYHEGVWVPRVGQFLTLDITVPMTPSEKRRWKGRILEKELKTFIVKKVDYPIVIIQEISDYDTLTLGSDVRIIRPHRYMGWRDDITGHFVFPGERIWA